MLRHPVCPIELGWLSISSAEVIKHPQTLPALVKLEQITTTSHFKGNVRVEQTSIRSFGKRLQEGWDCDVLERRPTELGHEGVRVRVGIKTFPIRLSHIIAKAPTREESVYGNLGDLNSTTD